METEPCGRWPDELLTGIPELDDAHRQIHRLLYGLHQTLEVGQAPEGLGERIRILEASVEAHFQEEEDLMASHGYPHLEPHQADHRGQVERMRELALRYLAPDAPPLQHMVAEMQNLLVEHVRQVDLDFARWEHMRRLESGH